MRTAAALRGALLLTATAGVSPILAQTASQITPPSYAPPPVTPQAPVAVPHVTLEQAKSFATAIAKGDRGAAQVIADTARQMIGTLREQL